MVKPPSEIVKACLYIAQNDTGISPSLPEACTRVLLYKSILFLTCIVFQTNASDYSRSLQYGKTTFRDHQSMSLHCLEFHWYPSQPSCSLNASTSKQQYTNLNMQMFSKKTLLIYPDHCNMVKPPSEIVKACLYIAQNATGISPSLPVACTQILRNNSILI